MSFNARMIGAPLPDFCRKCGLVEDHQVHHHKSTELQFGWHEYVQAHKFKAVEGSPVRVAHNAGPTSQADKAGLV